MYSKSIKHNFRHKKALALSGGVGLAVAVGVVVYNKVNSPIKSKHTKKKNDYDPEQEVGI